MPDGLSCSLCSFVAVDVRQVVLDGCWMLKLGVRLKFTSGSIEGFADISSSPTQHRQHGRTLQPTFPVPLNIAISVIRLRFATARFSSPSQDDRLRKPVAFHTHHSHPSCPIQLLILTIDSKEALGIPIAHSVVEKFTPTLCILNSIF